MKWKTVSLLINMRAATLAEAEVDVKVEPVNPDTLCLEREKKMKLVLQKEPMQCKTQELHKQYYVQQNVFTIGLASPVPDMAIMAGGLNYTLTLPPRCETIGFGAIFRCYIASKLRILFNSLACFPSSIIMYWSLNELSFVFNNKKFGEKNKTME